MFLRNLCLFFCLLSCNYLTSTIKNKPSISTKIRVVKITKETERLWKYAEKGNAKAFIHAYINKGGNLNLTNEYFETVVKVLLKSCNQLPIPKNNSNKV